MKQSLLILIAMLLHTSLSADPFGLDKTLTLKGITFHVQASNQGSLNQLVITPSGLSGENRTIKEEIEGSVSGVEVADLNQDGFPELYLYITSAGSGSYGFLVAYASNHNKSITPIYLPELADNAKAAQGYMGHDQFSIVKNRLERRFPLYNKKDSNANPTGGTRLLTYKLIAGEAGWQLKLEKSTVVK